MMNRNKLKYGGYSLLITVIFLTAVILLNVFAGMLTTRFFLKTDLTDIDLYTLNERAEEYLRDMTQPVDIIVLSAESVWLANAARYPTDRITDILQNYAATSNRLIRVQYADPDLNTFNGSKYNNSLSELKEAHFELENMARDDIIVLSEHRAARIPLAGLYAQVRNASGNVIPTLNTDQELITALLYVLSEQVARAVFIEGHREEAVAFMQAQFSRGGYITSSVNLLFEDIPPDTTVLISAGPKIDFHSEEIIKLENYLSSGGNAVILYDPSATGLTRLNEFVSMWGVSAGNALICDDQMGYPQRPNLVIAPVVSGTLPTLADAERDGEHIIIHNALPLFTDWAGGSRGGFTLFPMIETYASAYAKDLGGEVSSFLREQGDASGPFTTAYTSRYSSYDADNNLFHSHLIVSSVGLFSDELLMSFGQAPFYNFPLIAAIAGDLNPFTESVYIPPRQLVNRMMPVTPSQSRWVLILLVIVLPLAILGAGIGVWRKRRHQ
jgi:hypothetical protein